MAAACSDDPHGNVLDRLCQRYIGRWHFVGLVADVARVPVAELPGRVRSPASELSGTQHGASVTAGRHLLYVDAAPLPLEHAARRTAVLDALRIDLIRPALAHDLVVAVAIARREPLAGFVDGRADAVRLIAVLVGIAGVVALPDALLADELEVLRCPVARELPRIVAGGPEFGRAGRTAAAGAADRAG